MHGKHGLEANIDCKTWILLRAINYKHWYTNHVIVCMRRTSSKNMCTTEVGNAIMFKVHIVT